MTNYESVLKAIQAACPELMELSFGCKVLIEGSYTPRGEHIVYRQHDDVYEAANIGHTEIMTNDTTSFTRYKKTDYATLKGILGHTPRLSHVLRAMGEVNLPEDEFFAAYLYRDTKQKGFWICHKKERDFDLNREEYVINSKRWDLGKDDLSLQSEETINFLFDILCK